MNCECQDAEKYGHRFHCPYDEIPRLRMALDILKADHFDVSVELAQNRRCNCGRAWPCSVLAEVNEIKAGRHE